MRAIFNNQNYLEISGFHELYRRGYQYLSLNVETSISFQTLVNVFLQKDLLTKISIVDNDNTVIAQFNNIYNSLRSVTQDTYNGMVSTTIEFSSSEDGAEENF